MEQRAVAVRGSRHYAAARPANILASRAVWTRMVTLLERGDNILEGHYAERTFAAVLLPALPPHAVETILCQSRSVRQCSHTAGYCGTLYGCAPRKGNCAQA